MRIRSFAHKGLKRLYLNGDARGLPAEAVDRLRKMLSFLQDMSDPDELKMLPAWRAHVLTGKRRGTWSLCVTRNWRLTFRIDILAGEICDVNYEDYH